MRPPTPEQRRTFELAASTYQRNLAADTAAQEYLAQRGITPEVTQAFRLGVVTSPLVGDEQYRGRLAVPYLTPSGVINFTFRCLQHADCKAVNCVKYLAPPGDRNLFNVLDLAKPGQVICVAEGELDAITLSMCGLPAVGVPGVESWKPHWGRCLEDFSTIYVFADGDKAGRKFAAFMAKEARARPVRLPDGEDVNSLYVKGGSGALRQLIE